MSQEQLMTYAQSAILLPTKEILDITEASVMDRTLTARTPKKKRIAGLNRGMISMNEDFDAPLPDDFWLGRE